MTNQALQKNDNGTRDDILNGDLHKDKWNRDDVCKFLLMLKTPSGLMPNDEEDIKKS